MKRLSSMLLLCVVLVLSARVEAQSNAQSSEQSSEQTPSPPLRRAREAVASLALRAYRVQVWLSEARDRRQAARSRCLDPLLSQAHAVERQGQRELDAIEHAANAEAAKASLLRLKNIVARSRQIIVQANVCGKVVSRRVRAPTQYRVRLLATR